jgi:putative transposase
LLSKSKHDNKKIYRDLLAQGKEIDMDRVFEEKDAIGSFQTKITAVFPSIFRHVARKKHIAKITGIDLLSMDELERKIDSIINKPYTEPESRKARKYLIEQLIARGYKRDEISERLGISRKTIYNILKSTT